MKKLHIFDVDGVLADSWPMHHKFCCDMAKKYQPELIIPPPHKGPQFVTNGMEKFLQKVGFAQQFIKTIIQNDYVKFGDNYPIPLFDGVKQMILNLSISNQTNLAIVSANNKNNVLKMIWGLSLHFDHIVTNGDFTDKKEALHELLRIFKLKNSEAVFVGDAINDYEQAALANVPFIGAGYGWQIRPGDKLNCQIAESVSHLHKIVLKL